MIDFKSSNRLPPIGQITADNEQSAISFVQQIDMECYESLNGTPADGTGSVNSWLSLADDNLRIYELGDIDGVTPVYANDIQNAVIAITDRQSRESVMSSIDPVSVGEPPTVFWIGPPIFAMQLGIDPVYVSGALDPQTGKMIAPPPLPQQIVDQLPPEMIENDKWFVLANGEMTASGILQTNIAGWYFALYEFDHQAKTVLMTELSVHQVRMDPTVSTLEKAAYAGVWLLVDATWAFQKYPRFAELIESESQLGEPSDRGSGTNPLAEYASVNFRRKMLTMQIWWFRNQFVKLDEADAIASGHIVKTEIPIEQENADVPSQIFHEEEGQKEDADEAGQEEQAMALAGQSAAQDVGAGNAIVQIPTRTALVHAESGEEIDAAHDLWPVRLGLGRMVIINNHVVDWSEEDAWDIPLMHNVCIPVPRKPWGIGEPYRLLNMQRAYNRVWGSMVDHCDWNAHPPCLISESMHAATIGVYDDAKVQPGKTIIVDDATFNANGGKLDVVQPLPQMATHLPEVEMRMSQKLSESSGNTDVLQGRVPSGQAKSGKAIELLQSAGESTISLKAQNSGDMVYRLDRLILHDISRSFGVEDAMQVVKKYPAHVVEYLLAQGPKTEMQFAVSIAGGGAVSQAKRAKDQEDLQSGAISLETYRDRHNIDHKQEQARIDQQMMKQAQQQAQMQPQTQGA